MSAELAPWILFNLLLLILLALDLFLFPRSSDGLSVKQSLFQSFGWIALSLLFNVYLYLEQGVEPALSFLTGYLIEKALSIDNLFIFLLIFNSFQIPIHAQHKVLFWGLFSAIVMRSLFIIAGISLLTHLPWVTYLLGLFLIYTGLQMTLLKKANPKPSHRLQDWFYYFFKVAPDPTYSRFFLYKEGSYVATPLFLVLLTIESCDLLFALDSIPAILAITHDPFIVYTSNICALLGLRSLYFLLGHLIASFDHLHWALALILSFVGFKMIASNYLLLSTPLSLAIIGSILLTFSLTSLLFPTKTQQKPI